MKTKALVPIGTIVLIVTVLIATVGIYWYFIKTPSELDCSDVERKDTIDVYIYTIESEVDNIPLIHEWKQATNAKYRMWYDYKDLNEGGTNPVMYDTLDELEDALDTINIADIDKKQAQHIIHCIRATCPECKEG